MTSSLVIGGLLLFFVPFLLAAWSWKAVWTYLLLLASLVVIFWARHFYVISRPDFVDGAAGAALGLSISIAFTLAIVVESVLAIVAALIYRNIKERKA